MTVAVTSAVVKWFPKGIQNHRHTPLCPLEKVKEWWRWLGRLGNDGGEMGIGKPREWVELAALLHAGFYPQLCPPPCPFLSSVAVAIVEQEAYKIVMSNYPFSSKSSSPLVSIQSHLLQLL